MTLPNKILCVLGATIAVALAACAIASTNPLRRDAGVIRTKLLQKNPLGSSLNDVNTAAVRQGWKVRYHWQRLPADPFEPISAKNVDAAFPNTQTTELICIEIGGYQGWPWYTTVQSDWAFDSNGRLVGLHISKVEDAL
ncbi:MAG: hypothetical protein ABSH26_14650 [Opitutaceae bacterium]|jgi:hypothetical protein